MAGREYQGAGGLRLHLDEPLSEEMAKQVARGHLVPVDSDTFEPDPVETLESNGPVAPAGKPTANSKVDDWRTYAVSLGMPEEDAQDSTKKDLQDWVQVHEEAHGDGAQV